MSNIGSISNSGNKFNVVASTLSTEQLESFGKSGNLMPNAIIVSTSYINSYDNSLDLVISDKDGYGQSIMKDYKNAIETVSQHIYYTSNTTKPKYKTKYVQEGENGIGPETISLNKAIYTFAKDYSYIGSRFLTYDGTYSLNDYFSYLFSIIKHEKILITVTELKLNLSYTVPVTFNKDYLSIGFANGQNIPDVRLYNTISAKTYDTNIQLDTNIIKKEFNDTGIIERNCKIETRDILSNTINAGTPGIVTLDSISINKDVETTSYKTYDKYITSAEVTINGHNAAITVEYGGYPASVSDIILIPTNVINDKQTRVYLKSDKTTSYINYDMNGSKTSATACWNISEGILEGSYDFLSYSYKDVIYDTYNSTKDIIIYHKWINNNGFKKSGISIKPAASNFYVKYNKDGFYFYLTYTTGDYVPTENYKLDISEYNINIYYNTDNKGNYEVNWETNNTLKIESSLENNIIQITQLISTDEISQISTASGLYKVCAECKNQYLSSFINNNDDKNTLYMLRMDNVFFGVLANDTTKAKKYLKQERRCTVFNNVYDRYVDNTYTSSYLDNISLISIPFTIDDGEFMYDKFNEYNYIPRKIEKLESTNPQYPYVLYKYVIGQSDNEYIIVGYNNALDSIGNNYNEDVYPYKFKINVKGISDNGITTDINEICSIEYYYYENNEKHSIIQVNAGSYATINLKNKTQNLNVLYKITCSDANYVSDKDVRSIIIPVYDTVENTIVLSLNGAKQVALTVQNGVSLSIGSLDYKNTDFMVKLIPTNKYNVNNTIYTLCNISSSTTPTSRINVILNPDVYIVKLYEAQDEFTPDTFEVDIDPIEIDVAPVYGASIDNIKITFRE